jgi:hypothetical protein
LFSGTAGLSKAFAEAGFLVFSDFDIDRGHRFDLTSAVVQKEILRAIRQGFFWYVHLGTPCSVWSRARHNIVNQARARHKENIGVELALFSAVVAHTCEQHAVFWSIENPRNSRLWDFDPIAELNALDSTVMVETVHCAYQTSPFHLKPTKILTNFRSLESLSASCPGGHTHRVLEGQERFLDSQGVWRSRCRTSGAGAYPPRLCQAWAHAAGFAAPATARGEGLHPFDSVLTERIQNGLAVRSTVKKHVKAGCVARQVHAPSDVGFDTPADGCERQMRFDYLRPYIVFGQDTNLEVERKKAAKRSAGKLGRWPQVARL